MYLQKAERMFTFPFGAGLQAHVPQPPEQDPNVPPETPPPGAPDKEIDLPPREEPEDVREPRH